MSIETTADLVDVLQRNGFVRCDIAACNCGGWHARYGYPQRLDEVKELLSDAGHPLTNENGNLVKAALSELIAERDSLRSVNTDLLMTLAQIVHATSPTFNDGAYHENAYELALASIAKSTGSAT